MGAYAIPCDKPFVATKPVKTKTKLTPEQKEMRERYDEWSKREVEKKNKKQQG